MRTGRRLSKYILRTIARSEHRSPLFWWMVEHHDEIVASAGRRIHWKSVCAAAAECGLTVTRGQPPSERNARETWRQARLAVAEARHREQAEPPPKPGAKYPSRISPDWRPTLVPPPPIRLPLPAPAQEASQSGSAEEEIVLDDAAKERLARGEAALHRIDRKFKF